MTKLPRLYVVMLRYRVAAMIALFLLLGAAREGPLDIGLPYLFAVLALASSYVAATALNDLADEQIDKVNHPLDAGGRSSKVPPAGASCSSFTSWPPSRRLRLRRRSACVPCA